jgi:hypothetical protein
LALNGWKERATVRFGPDRYLLLLDSEGVRLRLTSVDKAVYFLIK